MNKWKISFWILLIFFLSISLYSFYIVTDKSVTIAFMRIGYSQTESDLKIVSRIYETDFTKEEIRSEILKDSIYEYLDFKKDTLQLQKVDLIFANEKLIKISPKY